VLTSHEVDGLNLGLQEAAHTGRTTQGGTERQYGKLPPPLRPLCGEGRKEVLSDRMPSGYPGRNLRA
jgi:hypothetical protein